MLVKLSYCEVEMPPAGCLQFAGLEDVGTTELSLNNLHILLA